jgi:hypothetical protein
MCTSNYNSRASIIHKPEVTSHANVPLITHSWTRRSCLAGLFPDTKYEIVTREATYAPRSLTAPDVKPNWNTGPNWTDILQAREVSGARYSVLRTMDVEIQCSSRSGQRQKQLINNFSRQQKITEFHMPRKYNWKNLSSKPRAIEHCSSRPAL